MPFTSKKNKVDLVETEGIKSVRKEYESEKACIEEEKQLLRLSRCAVPVPKILKSQKKTLILSYIEGNAIADVIAQENCDPYSLAKAIILWFKAYYNATEKDEIRGDVNCRNFILTPKGEVYSIDFEEKVTGDRETDAGRLCAYIVTYDVANTVWKRELARLVKEGFCLEFQLDEEKVMSAFYEELSQMEKRRGHLKNGPFSL